MYSLSVIIPFRADSNLPYLLNRLEDLCESFPKNYDIEFIVVDSGSDFESRNICSNLCQKNQVRYIFQDSENQTFSIGAARDFGVCNAHGRAVTFLDVDLRVAEDFWGRLLSFMSTFGISKNKKSFFVVPCLYLTQEGTEEFSSLDRNSRVADFYLRWLNGDSQAIQNMAPCSSVMVVDRLHYLSVGGHNPSFRGHGYEDFELYHRLIGEENIFPRAHDYYKDSKTWDTATYNGFRSQFSLLGRYALLSNLFAIHLWHPRPKTSSFYSNTDVNRTIWLDLFKEFDNKKEHPKPLVSSDSSYKKILFFGSPGTNASRCLKDIFPLLGDCIFVKENNLVDDNGEFSESDFKSLLVQHNIDLVFFPNPYGNLIRKKIYDWCRRTDFKFICFDRGALVDSWFFDSNGFNADSLSYSREEWNKQLSVNERKNVIDYIRTSLAGNSALEKQGQRIGRDALEYRLRVGGKKVLFVPLQRPSDTVIQYFSGGLDSFNGFLKFIDDAACQLRRQGWVVLVKKHPLETDSMPLNNAIYVPDDTHFIDLLELSDRVALINSGVGVYAMMMGKPCYIFGKAFYCFDGINLSSNTDDINGFCRSVIDGFFVNMDEVFKFIFFLKTKFYSFGSSVNKTRIESDGSLRNMTTAIDFYEIRLPNRKVEKYRPEGRKKISTSAPLFERFRLDLHNKRMAAEKLNSATAANKNLPGGNGKIMKDGRDKKGFIEKIYFHMNNIPGALLKHIKK